jgi:DNA-binding NarL/FixJ family response regulator
VLEGDRPGSEEEGEDRARVVRLPAQHEIDGDSEGGGDPGRAEVTRRLIEEFSRRPPEAAPSLARLASLTARERDILLLLARGRTNAEIAADVVVSEATVRTHVGHLLAKLGLRDRVQAVILAYETGIVVPGEPSS